MMGVADEYLAEADQSTYTISPPATTKIQSVEMLLEMCSHGINGQQIIQVAGSLRFTTDSGDLVDLVINEPLHCNTAGSNDAHVENADNETNGNSETFHSTVTCSEDCHLNQHHQIINSNRKTEMHLKKDVGVSSTPSTIARIPLSLIGKYSCSLCSKFFTKKRWLECHERNHRSKCYQLAIADISLTQEKQENSSDAQSSADLCDESTINRDRSIVNPYTQSQNHISGRSFRSKHGQDLHDLNHSNDLNNSQITDCFVLQKVQRQRHPAIFSRSNFHNMLTVNCSNQIVKSRGHASKHCSVNLAGAAVSSQNEYFCCYCGKLLKTARGLKFHELRHGKFDRVGPVTEAVTLKPECDNPFESHHGSENNDDTNSDSVERKARNPRQTTDPTKTFFNCTSCLGKSFSSIQSLIAHKYQNHVSMKCQRCGLTFRGRVAFHEHARVKHPNIPDYKINMKGVCELCSEICGNDRHLQDHIDTVHRGLVHRCEHCGKVVLTAYNLKVHIRDKHRHDLWRACEECGARFPRLYMLIRHLHRSHPRLLPEKYSFDIRCDECGMNFSCKSSLRRHIKDKHEHTEFGRRLECTHCKRVFTCDRYLRQHLKSSKSCGGKCNLDKSCSVGDVDLIASENCTFAALS